MFEVLDSEEKCYFLGTICCCGSFVTENNTTVLDVDIEDFLEEMLGSKLVELFDDTKEIDYIHLKSKFHYFRITSQNSLQSVIDQLGLTEIKNNKPIFECTTKLPVFAKDTLKICFLRGFLDGCMKMRFFNDNKNFEILIPLFKTKTHDLYDEIKKLNPKTCIEDNNYLCFSDTNAVDFLGVIYGNIDKNRIVLQKNYNIFVSSCTNTSNHMEMYLTLPQCQIVKDDPKAVLPFKFRCTDVGYDLTIIKEHERFGKNTVLYDTGIKAKPERGWYISIVPRSSLSKSGYIMTNSIGIVDPGYQGTLKIALTKIDPDKPDIVLPLRVAQMIFCNATHFSMQQTDQLDHNTDRGEKGYGSSDIIK